MDSLINAWLRTYRHNPAPTLEQPVLSQEHHPDMASQEYRLRSENGNTIPFVQTGKIGASHISSRLKTKRVDYTFYRFLGIRREESILLVPRNDKRSSLLIYNGGDVDGVHYSPFYITFGLPDRRFQDTLGSFANQIFIPTPSSPFTVTTPYYLNENNGLVSTDDIYISGTITGSFRCNAIAYEGTASMVLT